MTAQNIISATLTDEVKEGILRKLTEIRSDLDFLITLDPEQAKTLFKAANGFTPFIVQAREVAQEHPEILPNVFPTEEYEKDCSLIDALTPIQNRLNELSNAVRDTLVAANSDALAQSLEVYAAVKQHKSKVAGLSVASDNLGLFFQRRRTKVAEPGQN